MGLPRADGGCEMDAYEVLEGPSITSLEEGAVRGERCAPPYMSREDMALFSAP